MFAMMKHSGAKKPKKFNPEAFRADMMRLPPHEAADVTLKWRERAMNAADEMAGATDTAFKMLAGGTFVFLVGMLEGRQKAQAEKMIEDWEAGGALEAEADLEKAPAPWDTDEAKDPTKFLGFLPITLAMTALPAVFGLFDTGAAPYLRTMAMAGTYLFVGNLGAAAGHKMRENKLAKLADSEEDEE